jgi:K(+)-stimulated pyrophosphate-energized sodium pump
MRKATALSVLSFIFLGLFALPAFASGDENAKIDFTSRIGMLWILVPIGAIIPLVFAWIFHQQMKKADPGNEKMQHIAAAVRKGAFAYLFQQYKVVGIVFVILCIVLGIMAYAFNIQHWLVPWAFLTGGFFSGLCGFLGMNTATHASSRTAQAASNSLNDGLKIAFRSGAVMGFIVVGFGLLDIAAWFYVCNNILEMPLGQVVVVMLAFGMGASTQALFARVGGGIYTKAADVGADLVGKIEKDIPEDDPRNPATIADNVGDNVGDVAGMGADLYESYCGSILSTAALGFAAAQSMIGGSVSATDSLPWVMYPMLIGAVGNILAVVSCFVVRTGNDTSLKALMGALFRGINTATVLTAVAALALGYFLLNDSSLLADGAATMGIKNYIWGVWFAVLVGLVAGVIVAKATEYYTSTAYDPVKGIAKNALTGPATVIIDGTAVGMMAVGIPVITVVTGMFLSYTFAGGFNEPIQGLYGIAIAAAGMLSTLGITLATDAYGPIADNAGGNAQMAGLPEEVRERTDALDACGNTTAATGKGFAIASAALTAMALLVAYVEEVRAGIDMVSHTSDKSALEEKYEAEDPRGIYSYDNVTFEQAGDKGVLLGSGTGTKNGTPHTFEGKEGAALTFMVINRFDKKIEGKPRNMEIVPVSEASLDHFMTFYRVNLMNPNVLIGLFLGGMMVFVFCAMTMKAVGRAAQAMVMEVRRQFREIAGIMEGTTEPDYASCVSISTKGAQREMILPSCIAIACPIVVGLLFGVAGVMGLLAGTLACGFSVAIMMAAAGGAWDNAKKHVEQGGLTDEEGNVQGKGSDAHSAAIIGDMVGDPFKDTSGPSLNILIKLMTMVSIVFVGLIVKFSPAIQDLWR